MGKGEKLFDFLLDGGADSLLWALVEHCCFWVLFFGGIVSILGVFFSTNSALWMIAAAICAATLLGLVMFDRFATGLGRFLENKYKIEQ